MAIEISLCSFFLLVSKKNLVLYSSMAPLTTTELLDAQECFLDALRSSTVQQFLPLWKSLETRMSSEARTDSLSLEVGRMGLSLAKKVVAVVGESISADVAAEQEIGSAASETRQYLAEAGSSALDLAGLTASLPPIGPPPKPAKSAEQKKSPPAAEIAANSLLPYRNWFLEHLENPYPTALQVAKL